MDTKQLILNMLDEGPKKPLLHPMKQTSLWLMATFFYLAAGGVQKSVSIP